MTGPILTASDGGNSKTRNTGCTSSHLQVWRYLGRRKRHLLTCHAYDERQDLFIRDVKQVQIYKILETVLTQRRFQCFMSFLPLYKQEVKANQTGDYSDG